MINGNERELRYGRMLLPIQRPQLQQLAILRGRPPPPTNTTTRLEQLRYQIDPPPMLNPNATALRHTLHLILPSLRSVFFSNEVIQIEEFPGDFYAGFRDLVTEELWELVDDGDVVRDVALGPLVELFLHGRELVLEQAAIGLAHLEGGPSY